MQKRTILPVDVDLRGIDVANLLSNANDNRERLVELEKGDVIGSDISLLESDGEGNSGCLGEINGINTSIGPSYGYMSAGFEDGSL